MIQAGVPLTYIRDQLGHSSIKVTVDIYARWLPRGDKTYVDRLDQSSPQGRYGRLETTKIRPRRIRVVTNLDSAEEPPPQVVERSGTGERTRTADLLITNHQQGRTCRRGRIQLDEFASVYVRRRLTRATGVQPLGGQRARTCQTLSSHCRPVWTTYELKLKAENATEVLDCFGPAVDVL